MIKFTKEEINLCKQIVEKYRKEIEYGDWFIMPSDPHLFPTILEASPTHKLWKSEINKKAIPLWTISDCLEFLRGKSGSSLDDPNYGSLHLSFSVDIDTTITRVLLGTASVNDLNIACLKAVLAVVEEAK